MEANTLKVGLLSVPPLVDYKIVENTVEPEGIYPTLLKKIADNCNLNIEFIPIQHEDALELLETNKVDVLSNFMVTTEREELFDFAALLFTLSVGGVVRKEDERINTIRDLKETPVKIALCKGAIGTDLVKNKLNIGKESGRIIELETSDVADIISLVKAGIADIAITDNLTIQYNLIKNKADELKQVFTSFPLYISEIGLMLQKDQPEFRNWLNEQTQLVRDDQEIKEMEEELYKIYEDAVQPY